MLFGNPIFITNILINGWPVLYSYANLSHDRGSFTVSVYSLDKRRYIQVHKIKLRDSTLDEFMKYFENGINMIKNKNSTPLVFSLLILLCVAAQASGQNCEPRFEKIQAHRSLPHSFFDQAMASLPKLYPKHVMLTSRRFSQIANIRYSLIAYKKEASSDSVQIEGVVVHHPHAWNFNAFCLADNAIDGVINVLEKATELPDTEIEWQSYKTDYLELEIPGDWEAKTGTHNRVRFNAPGGMFESIVLIGAYSNSTIDNYKNNNAYELEEMQINGTTWLKDQRLGEETVETTLITPYKSGIIQVMINYGYEDRAKYKEITLRIIHSLKIFDYHFKE